MKKFNKILSLALVLVMVLSLVPAMTFGTVAEENWTEVDTLDELKTALAAGGNVKITVAELDFTGTTDYYNMPVAAGTVLDANGCVFTGVSLSYYTSGTNKYSDGLFDLGNEGRSFTVKNLTVGSSTAAAIAVDSVMVKASGDKMNVNGTFENVTIYAQLNENTHAGAFASYPAGVWSFTDCDVYLDHLNANGGGGTGAYIGRCESTLSFVNCTANNFSAEGLIQAAANVGGFVGTRNNAGTAYFENCTNNATIKYNGTNSGHGVAAFIGQDRGASVDYKATFLACTNNGTVTPNGEVKVAEFATNNANGVADYAALTPKVETAYDNFTGYKTLTEVAYSGINNADALVAALAAGGTVKLLNDIDMTGKENITVAANTILDGNGKKLTNVAVGTDNAKYGLFNFASNTGITVKNLTITGTGVNTFVASDNGEGLTPNVTFENLTVVATLKNPTAEVGAFGGRVHGTWTFKGCDVDVTVVGAPTANAGTYFGRFWGDATFENCVASGTIENATGNAGGYMGVKDATGNVSFQNCTNEMNISANSSNVNIGIAGFVGQSRTKETGAAKLTLLNCENKGTMTINTEASVSNQAQFVTGRGSSESDGFVYCGNLTGNGTELVNFANLHADAVEVLYSWDQLQTAGEYKIGPAYPAIPGDIPVADGVTIDGLGNTLTWNGAPNAIFTLAANATVNFKNLSFGSAGKPMSIYQGILWMTEKTEGSTMAGTTTTWENVHAYVQFTLANGNSGAFMADKAYGNHTFIDCSATISGTTKANREGAFVGRNYGNMTFIRCTADGKITANDPGAFVGRGDGTNQTFIDCVNNAKLSDGTAVENFVALDGVEGTNYFNYTTPQLKAVQETTAEGGVQKIRFLAAVAENGITPETAATSPLTYGFTVTATVGGATKFTNRSFTLKNLYEAVTATEDGTTESVTAGDLGGTYIAALVLTGVPAEGTVVFTVTPWMTYADDAAAVTGATYTVTYTDGVFVSAEPSGVENLPLVPQA